MKKALCIIMSVILAACVVMPAFADTAAPADTGYKRVFIIGIDGAGRFIKDAETPEFDRIFADGAVDYTRDSNPILGSASTYRMSDSRMRASLMPE